MRSITLGHPISSNDVAFPRAAFGFPIVFHFIRGTDSVNNCELYPKDKKRMASSLILLPLAVNDGKQAVAMVLRLSAPEPESLEFKNLNLPTSLPSLEKRNISRTDLANYANSPMGHSSVSGSKRSTRGSALEAFIAFALEKGFEVKP